MNCKAVSTFTIMTFTNVSKNLTLANVKRLLYMHDTLKIIYVLMSQKDITGTQDTIVYHIIYSLMKRDVINQDDADSMTPGNSHIYLLQ